MAAGRPHGIGAIPYATWVRASCRAWGSIARRSPRESLQATFNSAVLLRAGNGRSVGTWSERYREAGRVRRVRGGSIDAHEVNLSTRKPRHVLRALTCIFGSSRFFRLRALVRLSSVIDFEGLRNAILASRRLAARTFVPHLARSDARVSTEERYVVKIV